VWKTQRNKSLLLTSSSNPFKMAIHYSGPYVSFNELRIDTKRAILDKYHLSYTKHLIWVYQSMTWFTKILTVMTWQTKFHVNNNNKLRVGLNALCNHYHSLNDKIPRHWFNKSFLSYKIECKEKFLAHNLVLWQMIFKLIALKMILKYFIRVNDVTMKKITNQSNQPNLITIQYLNSWKCICMDNFKRGLKAFLLLAQNVPILLNKFKCLSSVRQTPKLVLSTGPQIRM
jgi:hypothetical protein